MKTYEGRGPFLRQWVVEGPPRWFLLHVVVYELALAAALLQQQLH